MGLVGGIPDESLSAGCLGDFEVIFIWTGMLTRGGQGLPEEDDIVRLRGLWLGSLIGDADVGVVGDNLL